MSINNIQSGHNRTGSGQNHPSPQVSGAHQHQQNQQQYQQQHQQQQQHHFDIATWERKSKLDIEQSLVLNNLQSFVVSERPLPTKFIQSQQQQQTPLSPIPTATTSSAEDEDKGVHDKSLKLPEKPIENLGQFYDWFSMIEKSSTHLHQYEWFLETIVSYGQGTDELQNQVQDCESLVDSIQSDYSNLTKKTSQLHDSCEKFFKDELRLRYIVQTIHEKLKYYLELEQSTKRFNSSNLQVTDPAFVASLETLEDSIQFMKKNANFQASGKYSLQYSLLFQRALGLIKDYICSSLKIITKEILTSTKDWDQDFQISNIKFRAFAPKLKPLCHELEKRAVGPYVAFIKDCHNVYFKNRKLILTPTITMKLAELAKNNEDIPTMVQNLCIYMVQIYENEYQVYIDFFDNQTFNFNDLLDEYSQQLYDTIRPIYIHMHSFESLCNLAHLVRNEILEDIIEQSTKYSNGLKLAVQRMLQDIQERLLFLIQTYIRDEIRTFSPKPEDMDYPNHLQSLKEETTTGGSMYSTWYPTLEKTLTCLSKLYLVVDNKIFEGLAQEAVEAYSYLFLIKYFIILREQITPFDINFVIIEKIVDFPNLKHALSTLYNYGSLFALSTNNPLYNVIQSAANPRVTNTSIDSKKDLEKELKHVIESFIISTSNNAIDHLLSLLTKISVHLNQSGTDNHLTLSQQSFAEPARVKETIEATVANINSYLPVVLSKMKLYLSPMTQGLLAKPIRTNIADGFDQINQYARKYYTDDQIKSMHLLTSDELKAILDNIVPVQLSIKTSTSNTPSTTTTSSSVTVTLPSPPTSTTTSTTTTSSTATTK
ncbi:hypothetical protein SAMD00019534_092360 [Acytostelium subglobosum LB1]|uniref:hypothetical protein n=1 Tax=Acytostelium subglobosum LB1 TaxID=1410327 RepID=UPI0006450EE3|nr:hypothetical protein SAMD00019534_092360 [Acytostelium subglobosum LB1]GAM26061.1 hypothetical protein SAMD00019534_092360 [Acytostelium subglobosum LB1]|eukprot:XP_012751104.1 hypothetical protein SAMD00019534_092360 [Acytostelium subglobosum LB1]